MSASLDLTYFLSIETWKQYGFTDSNVDSKKLLPIIYSVQRTRIEPVIGTTLYNKLVTDIDAGSVTGLYKTLLDDHIIPTMIVYCDIKATFHTTSQITNKTTGQNQDQHIRSNTRDQNNNLRDELIKDVEALEDKMKAWLCDNWESIPELYEAVDADLLAQTLQPDIRNENDYFGGLSII